MVIRFLLAFGALSIFVPLSVWAQESMTLHECHDEKLAVKFLCNPDWELETQEDTLFIVIHQDPAVTLTIAKADSEIVLIEQLTPEVLKEMGQYGDGFSTQMVQAAGNDTIQVDGYSQVYPEIRLRDYYVIRDFQLYSILFSVNPRERWEEYQNVFEEIIQSLRID